MKTKRNDKNVVRQIIMEELATASRVSKFYVIERIKVMIHYIDLITKVVGRKRDCQDGIKNIQRGANLVFSDSWRRLKSEFEMDEEGWISLPAEPQAEAITQGAFAVRQSENVGQEILDADGKIIAWTTDSWVAQVIARLLKENENLLYEEGELK